MPHGNTFYPIQTRRAYFATVSTQGGIFMVNWNHLSRPIGLLADIAAIHLGKSIKIPLSCQL
jgi:hypothetical protein